MKAKLELDGLAQELQIEIANHLRTPELFKLARTSKHYLSLYSDLMIKRKFLLFAVHGKFEELLASIIKDRDTIFKRGRVTDCSGRFFDNISAFEYSLWSWDMPLWSYMTFPPEKEEELAFYENMFSQYNKVSTEGVSYVLNGKKITEKHFDFEDTIIRQLQTLASMLSIPSTPSQILKTQWIEGVGGAQKLLPMHAVFEYCSKEPFSPVPKFVSWPDEPSSKYYDLITQKYVNWFDDNSKLGSEIAVSKGTRLDGNMTVGSKDCTRLEVEQDLQALKELFQSRKRHFIILRDELGEEGILRRKQEQELIELMERADRARSNMNMIGSLKSKRKAEKIKNDESGSEAEIIKIPSSENNRFLELTNSSENFTNQNFIVTGVETNDKSSNLNKDVSNNNNLVGNDISSRIIPRERKDIKVIENIISRLERNARNCFSIGSTQKALDLRRALHNAQEDGVENVREYDEIRRVVSKHRFISFFRNTNSLKELNNSNIEDDFRPG
ncbi:MAG: hypothetical protein Q8M40_06740 [Legionella sp.]|nr:hypothetical protein [Legionella sp.]